MPHCCTVAQEAVIGAAKATEIKDIMDAAKENAAPAKQNIWTKLLLDHIEYNDTDLLEIVFLDRGVRAAQGK